ncbi:MAG: class II fumarate hydratase [Acidithiobacillus sp.]|uniref:class II fumarate hydratase n=1 Tax=Acidithiobacillus sp. TaxID=1872118 RepID=UPI003D019F97
MSEAWRDERDSLGVVRVAADALWGAQTQRSLEHFAIGTETMPLELIHALAQIKGAAALVNAELGLLPAELAAAIAEAAAEVAAGRWDAHFPLRVWQTGSGTQSNMNVNEVIANLVNERLGSTRGSKCPVHPNDHVNLGQSSNDVFPTAMHLAVLQQVHEHFLPRLAATRARLAARARDFAEILKIGRTHLMDAVPLSLGQEFSGYADQLRQGEDALRASLSALGAVALGGTAVGTGLNTHPDFARRVCARLADATGMPLHPAENPFAALAGHEALTTLSAALRTLAMSAMKLANDIRWMGSGPRAGLGELALPENEPGSSIMPGKVNPTQAEALTMVCVQVFGNDAAVAFAASQGQFELNVFKPVIVRNVLHSLRLLGDALDSFGRHCLDGLQPRREVLARHLHRSLMLVTALAPRLGYEKAATVAQYAHRHDLDLLSAVLALGYLEREEAERLLQPEQMLGPAAPQTTS